MQFCAVFFSVFDSETKRIAVRGKIRQKILLRLLDFFYGNIQKHLLLCTYKRHNLLPKRHCGLVLLPQQLHETLSVFQTLYGLLIQFAAETGEYLHFTILRKVKPY